jgi:glycosyltransferase involved in cell wall biosynthesis
MDSIIRQTLKEIEIICVDAESTDGTADLIENYVKNDVRVKHIVSDVKSTGYQITVGIKAARGKFIGIVESDDYIELDALSRMYELAERNDLDILKCDFSSFVQINDERFFMPRALAGGELEYGKIYNTETNRLFFTRPEYWWNGLFKRDFLIRNEIYPNSTMGAAFQDKGFFTKSLFYAERCMWSDISAYRYRRDNAESSTWNPKAIPNVINEYKMTFDFLRDKENATDIRTLLFWRFFEYLNKPQFIIFRPFYYESVKENYDAEKQLLMQVKVDGIKRFDRNYTSFLGLDEFMDEPDLFFLNLKRKTEFIKDYYRKWIDNLSHYPKIYIFGAGKIGAQLFVFLTTNGISVTALCDNDEGKIGTIWGKNTPIVSISDTDIETGYYVISAKKYNYDIHEQLIRSGVSEDRIEQFRGTMDDAVCVCKI